MADAEVTRITSGQDFSKAELTDKEGHAQKSGLKKKQGGEKGGEKGREEKQAKDREGKAEEADIETRAGERREGRGRPTGRDSSAKPDAVKTIRTNQDVKPSDADFNRALFRKQFQAEESMNRVRAKAPEIQAPVLDAAKVAGGNAARAAAEQMTQLQQAMMHSWRERSGNLQRAPMQRFQLSEQRGIEQKISEARHASRLAEQIQNLPTDLRNPRHISNHKENPIVPPLKPEQKPTPSWIPIIAKHIPETVRNLPEAVKSIPTAVKSLPEAVKGIFQPIKEKIDAVRKTEDRREPPKAPVAEITKTVRHQTSAEVKPDLKTLDARRPEVKVEVPIQRQIQKDISRLIITKLGISAPQLAPKVATIVKESPELRKLIEHIVKIDPKPTQTAREQLQRMVTESFRISTATLPQQPAQEQLRKVVADTASKLGTIYGLPLKEIVKPSDATKAEPAKKPASSPPPPPSSGSGSPPPIMPGYRAPPAPGAFTDKKDPDVELKEAKEKTEKDKAKEKSREKEKKDNSDKDAQYSEYERKIREERNLVVQRTYTISGVIMDKLSHKGIEGVFVNGGWLGTAVSNNLGEFNFYNVPENKVYTLTFLKRGFKFTPSSVTDTVDGPNRHYIYGINRR